ncbi:MAG: Thiopurine S-methyltransferase [uncultured Sulfurovum sp.]|uniref:Thiopurine S-methyltransferase n=1 Tax=uncultured Sulfurovum sp. TaxID=269237 RepID=A0A6S6TUF8_9BACT|nr:MAG: Thiopurine S-methyltransferase [uncultured Sulfurovum sp.]
MEKHIWLERWENNETGFHESSVNPLLLKHFHALELPLASRIFVPLCGKSLDVGWFLAKGYCVVGVEFSESAVKELFKELEEEPYVVKEGHFTHYSAENIDIYVGDFFDLTLELVGNIDAIYDRASIVALPAEARPKYAKHMLALTRSAPQLLVSIEYDQNLSNRTPFNVDSDELHTHYAEHYTLSQLDTLEIEGGFKGKIPASDTVWLLDDLNL